MLHTPRTPVTTLWLHPPFCYDGEFASRFARTLPSVKLGSLVRCTEVLFRTRRDANQR